MHPPLVVLSLVAHVEMDDRLRSDTGLIRSSAKQFCVQGSSQALHQERESSMLRSPQMWSLTQGLSAEEPELVIPLPVAKLRKDGTLSSIPRSASPMLLEIGGELTLNADRIPRQWISSNGFRELTSSHDPN